MFNIYDEWDINKDIVQKTENIENELKASSKWKEIDETREFNQLKVLKAFQDARISDAGFGGSSGYGYNDLGRERLEAAFSLIMKTEASLFRIQISSGTSAISAALFGNLRPGETMLSVTGLPYDSIYPCIGLDERGKNVKSADNKGSLKDFDISFEYVSLLPDGRPDFDGISDKLRQCGDKISMVYIQRSCGYSPRPALGKDEIKEICKLVRDAGFKGCINVDNCYGEFTCIEEPTQWGADLACGSLIKNPGGGIAPCGGYICGKKEFVDRAAGHITAPGLGSEVGSSLGQNRLLSQGLFFAPHVVSETLKGLSLMAALFEAEGIKTEPCSLAQRSDIVQKIELGSPEKLLSFCRMIQSASAVDSFVSPVAGRLPGYSHEVVMASGSFISGSSIELSADGPMTPPYRVYLQGGLNYDQLKLAGMLALQSFVIE